MFKILGHLPYLVILFFKGSDTQADQGLCSYVPQTSFVCYMYF